MRSKEVEEAINDLMFIVVTDIYGNKIRIDNKSVGTVLDYIKELENGQVEKTNFKIAELEYKLVELQKEKQQVLDDYQDLGKDLANNFISKEVIREKIEEYRNKRNKLANGEFWENRDNINQDKALFIAGEVLKELLG